MTFEQFLSAAESGSDRFNGNELAQHALRNANYVEFLSRWASAVGRERIHIHLFEDALSDPCRFMQGLGRQFGIAEEFYDQYGFPAENQTYTVRSRSLQKLNVSLRSWLPQGGFYNAMRGIYRQLNTRVEPARDLSSIKAEAALSGRYADANRQLAKEFGLGLDAWNAVHRKRLEKIGGGEKIGHVTR